MSIPLAPTTLTGGTQVTPPNPGGNTTRMLKVVFSRRRTATEQVLNSSVLWNFELYEINGTDPDYHILLDEVTLDIDEGSLAARDRLLPTVAIENWIRFTPKPYDNTSAATQAATGWIEVSVFGVVVARLSPRNSYHPNTSGQNYGGDFTAAGASKWHGICFQGGGYDTPTGSANALSTKAFGGRFVRLDSAVTPPTNPGKSDVVAFTSGRVDVGTLGVDQALTQCALTAPATAPEGREVQTTTMLTTITAISSSPRTYVFAVDGTTPIIVDPVGRTVNVWTNTAGVTPLEDCRIIGSWRGRLFLGNYDQNPSYWALSKIVRASNDATAADLWTTGGTDPTRAFSGVASDSPGRPSTAVTGFTEFDNGRAIMFCAAEVLLFDGDPGYGGRLISISKETGCLGPRAFTFDEEGNLFFVGPSGLFIIPRGTTDVKNISGNRLASILNRVDTSRTMVQCVYDSLKRSVHVFLTPRDGVTQGTHALIETAENAPWKDQMPVTFGPLGVCKITGETPDDRRFLIIGTDGYIRRPVSDRRDDDGSPIDCWVRYPVIEAADGTRKIMVYELQAVGSGGSGPVDWVLRSGMSAAQVLQQSVDDAGSASGQWFGDSSGFQVPTRVRVANGAIQLQVRQDSANESFSVERFVLKAKDSGTRRV